MALLTAKDLSKSFGPDEIFDGVTVDVPKGARIAIVGPNGAGKTTLLHILIGQDSSSAGSVHTAKNLQIGFLPQRPELLGDHTLLEEALRAFDDLREQETRLSELEARMADGDEEALARYSTQQEAFELAGGYTYPQRTQAVLSGLGFDSGDLETPLTELSGGQRTRAVLARLLLEAPDLLALDEPTNHLDIQAVEWLESYLKDYEGAVVAISHDRYFIDAMADTVWEMEFGTLETYRANYTQYVRQRDERHERLLKEYEAQQAFIAKEEEYIKRNIAGQNTRQAQGRRKRLNRLKRDKLIRAPKGERQAMRLNMQINHRGNEFVFSTHDLTVGYPGAPVLTVPDLKLLRGEIAALIGPNGSGKSTFIKTVTSKLDPFDGEVRVGDKVEVGYFAQAHELLNPNSTVLDEVMAARPGMVISEARDYLARYLFTGDDVFREIGTLSGGERGRVALATLALGTANLLLLDEPTNHLDIDSQEVLQEMIEVYPGTVLLVSHDRYLIDELATQIWSATPGEPGELSVYRGLYREFVAARQTTEQTEKQSTSNGTNDHPAKTQQKKHGLNPYQLQKRIDKIETQIQKLEEQLEAISSALETASSAGDAAKVQDLGEDYAQIQQELDEAMELWTTLME